MAGPRSTRSFLRPPIVTGVAVAVAALTLAACDTDDGRTLREPTSEQRAAMTTTTTSTTVPGAPSDLTADGAFVASTLAPTTTAAIFTLQTPWPTGGAIDARFTCDGEDRSPTLTWTAPPAGTVEMALLVTDDDANGFVHWAVAGIPPSAGEVGEGATITGAIEGRNDMGEPGWGGPCPPAGAAHSYRFTLYALNQQAELPEDFTGADLLPVAESARISFADTTGTYTRAS